MCSPCQRDKYYDSAAQVHFEAYARRWKALERSERSLGRPRLIFLLLLIELIVVLAPWVALSVTSSLGSTTVQGSPADGSPDRDSLREEVDLPDGGKPATGMGPHSALQRLVIASILPSLTFIVLFLVMIRRHPPQ